MSSNMFQMEVEKLRKRKLAQQSGKETVRTQPVHETPTVVAGRKHKSSPLARPPLNAENSPEAKKTGGPSSEQTEKHGDEIMRSVLRLAPVFEQLDVPTTAAMFRELWKLYEQSPWTVDEDDKLKKPQKLSSDWNQKPNTRASGTKNRPVPAFSPGAESSQAASRRVAMNTPSADKEEESPDYGAIAAKNAAPTAGRTVRRGGN